MKILFVFALLYSHAHVLFFFRDIRDDRCKQTDSRSAILCWLHGLQFGQIQYRSRGNKRMGNHFMGHSAVKKRKIVFSVAVISVWEMN